MYNTMMMKYQAISIRMFKPKWHLGQIHFGQRQFLFVSVFRGQSVPGQNMSDQIVLYQNVSGKIFFG